ncbi:hypothetical protein KRP22_009119 [Phytophthora ramorum]|nr:Synembryn-A [Phytophthora ramorum]
MGEEQTRSTSTSGREVSVAAMWPWIEEFVRAVESSAVELDSVAAREQATDKVREVLSGTTEVEAPTTEQNGAIFRLLGACRVFMRDRRGIDALLTAETLDAVLVLAETRSWSSRVREEALKCMINSVYSRPEFVSETLVVKGLVTRLMELAKQGGTASLHWLIWKVLLVSCEAPEVLRYLSTSLEAWKIICATLLYSFKNGNQAQIIAGDRATLLLDLIKLVSVLVNDMQWTAEQEKLRPEVFHTVHHLGGLLLEILRFNHSEISPLNGALIELKNAAMEVFMLLPGSLLAAFIQQQDDNLKNAAGNKDEIDGSMLSSVINHLQAMLLIVRIEKTRPLKDMLPVLIVCHNLAKTSDPGILSCFKKAILPGTTLESAAGPPPAIDRTKMLFFKHLKFFLTCLHTDVRRYTSEWLFLLCDQNAKEYTNHTGVGNAIGLLRMKGLA